MSATIGFTPPRTNRARTPTCYPSGHNTCYPSADTFTEQATCRTTGRRVHPPNSEPAARTYDQRRPRFAEYSLEADPQHDLPPFVRRTRQHVVGNPSLFQRKHGPHLRWRMHRRGNLPGPISDPHDTMAVVVLGTCSAPPSSLGSTADRSPARVLRRCVDGSDHWQGPACFSSRAVLRSSVDMMAMMGLSGWTEVDMCRRFWVALVLTIPLVVMSGAVPGVSIWLRPPVTNSVDDRCA